MKIDEITKLTCLALVLIVMVCGSAGSAWGQCPTMDFTGDCWVDLSDFVVFASQWLDQGLPYVDDIAWVYINDPGVSGHEAFNGYMSKYETTNGQYCQFLNAALASGDIIVDGNYIKGADGLNLGADFVGENYYDLAGGGWTFDGATNGGAARINYNGSSFTVDSGFDDHPITYVSWYGATAFCNYYGWRLPTEWEWQAVADYDGSYQYACGPTINNNVANYKGSIHPHGTTPVGTFGIYGYGLADMAGNVYEWTSTTVLGGYLTWRSSAWHGYSNNCSVSFRDGFYPVHMFDGLGFRVCR